MNLFTTDHPMTTQVSCFDERKRPWLSFVWNSTCLALILTPLFYGCVLFFAFTDPVQSTEDISFLNSWIEFLSGLGVVFIFSLVCASLLVSVYRWLRYFGRWLRAPLAEPGRQATSPI